MRDRVARRLLIGLAALALAPPLSFPAVAQDVVRALRPASTVLDLCEDDDGFVWLATSDGAFRYDGRDALYFGRRRAPPLHSSFIRKVVAAEGGGVWLAIGPPGETRTGSNPERPALARLHRDGSVRHFDERDGLPSAFVTAMARAAGEDLVIATARGLVTFSNGRFRRFRHSLPDADVRVLRHAADGRLWVGTAAGACRMDDDGRCTPRGPRVAIDDIAFASDGSAWLASAGGLLVIDSAGEVRERILDGTAVNAVLVEDDAVFIAGPSPASAPAAPDLLRLTRAGRTDPQRLAVVPPDAGVHVIRRTRDGLLWIATAHAGALALGENAVTTFEGPDHPPRGQVRGLAIDARGQLWSSQGSQLLVRDHERSTPVVIPLDGATPGPLAAARDVMWVGTDDRGLLRVSGGAAHAFPLGLGAPERAIASIAFDTGDGTLVVAREDGAIVTIAAADTSWPTVTRTLTRKDGICGERVFSAAPDGRGGFWLGGANGTLSRIGADQVACHRPLGESDDSHKTITSLLVDGPDEIWFGVDQDGGLHRFEGDRVSARLGFHQGLACDSVHQLAADEHHYWIGCQAGLSIVARAGLAAFLTGQTKKVRSYGVFAAQGLPSDHVATGSGTALVLDGGGSAWVGTALGLARVLPPSHWAHWIKPRPIIESVWLNGKTTRTLTSDRADVRIRFNAPWTLRRSHVQLRARIVGASSDWRSLPRDDTVLFTGLPPGRYRVEVQASNGIDGWSQPAMARFEIVPPFLQSRGFLALVGALVVLLAASAHRLRIRQLRRQQAAVHAERARIARDLHDGLAQGFAALNYQITAAMQPNEPGAPAHHRTLQDAKDTLRACREEAWRTIWDLRQQPDQSVDLEAVIRNAVVQVASSHGAPRLALTIAKALPPPSPHVAFEIGRIVQEAVSNACTHGQAERVDVTVDENEHQVSVTIIDDGTGFDPEGMAGPGHFGLLGIHERAQRMAGTVTIASAEGRGTCVTLSLPLDRFRARPPSPHAGS